MANSYEVTKLLVDINCLHDGRPHFGQRRGRLGSYFMVDWLFFFFFCYHAFRYLRSVSVV